MADAELLEDMSNSLDIIRKTNASIWALISLATIFLGLRGFCKFSRRKGLWWDDWILLPSWLALIASGILITINLDEVFGSRNAGDDDNIRPFRGVGLLNLIAGTLLFLGSAWSKTSFALALIRIVGSRLKLGLWFIIISMNLIITISVVLRWVQCQPAKKGWDFYATEGTCLDRNAILSVTYFAAAYSALMDFVLAFLPWPIISKLRMATSEKIGVSIAMSTGVFAGATAIVRCIKLQDLTGDDVSHNVFDLAVWSVAEISTTIMAATIPVLRGLVREATGSNGRPGCPIRYIRNLSREVSSRVRTHQGGSNTTTVSAIRWSRSGCPANDAGSDKDALHPINPEGRIVKMEEVHIQYDYKEDCDNIVYELDRVDRHPRPWA
ncbi:hypothetical protein F5X99DRAFT_388096 [Biscogniauxia marginata]|nr:hypothetical protein F5X99DRAFT_388096 [Biscogniauxia marginata]